MKAKLTTTARGYGHDHAKVRKAALVSLRDGDPCAQCWHDYRIVHPMFRAAAKLLDLSHNQARTDYIGLSWRRCNRREGASRGNRLRGQRSVTRYSRIW